MSLDQITQIQRELGLTDTDVKTIKSVKLVWDKLEALRKQAERDDRYAQAYRECLSKALKQSRVVQAPDSVDDVERNCRELWAWYDGECERLNVRDKETRRGMPHQAWCAKWLTEPYTHYERAVGVMIDTPSPQNISEVKLALTKLLQAYIAAV